MTMAHKKLSSSNDSFTTYYNSRLVTFIVSFDTIYCSRFCYIDFSCRQTLIDLVILSKNFSSILDTLTVNDFFRSPVRTFIV